MKRLFCLAPLLWLGCEGLHPIGSLGPDGGGLPQGYTRVDSPAGDYPHSVAVADLNGDHLADLVVANAFVDTVSVLLGRGDGTFSLWASYGIPASQGPGVSSQHPFSVTLGDVNGDGRQDLITANDTGRIFWGQGNGTFVPGPAYPGDTLRRVSAADVDHDGHLDLVAIDPALEIVSVLRGAGDGTFPAVDVYPTGSHPQALLVADLNGDGWPDLAVANRQSGTVSVRLNQKDGNFLLRTDYPTGRGPAALAAGPVRGSRLVDLVVANQDDDTVGLLWNQGGGTFAPGPSHATGRATSPSALAVSDVDGDGVLDLLVANLSSDRVSLFLGAGQGDFQPRVDFPAGTNPSSVAVLDLSAAGGEGLLSTGWNSASVSVFLKK